MATDISSAPVNGNYASHGGYGSDQNNSGYSASNNTSQPSYGANANSSTSTASGTSDIPKDEVGWYFVEQYYTTLSRSPEKLYLFYNKRSQFVLGQETDKVAVSVGQRAINERIKELDFQDCKVRVTNVDSQSSDSNIVIQVIGEISNKAAPHKKFTQTFVLAGQTNGYFVLNDIFRYIVEEEDEAEPEQAQPETVDAGLQEPAPTLSQSKEPETLTSSEDPAAIENDVKKVNKQLEEKVLNNPSSEQMEISPAPANGVSGAPEDENKEIIHAEEAPVAAIGGPTEEASTAASTSVAEENLSPEKPKDPEPTPTMSPVKQAAQPAAQPASPAASSSAPSASSKPSVPKSWASLAAAAHKVATPVTPIPQAANSAAPAQPKAAPVPAAPSASTPTAAPATPATAPAREASPASSQQDEWTSVGGDNKKQQSKVQAGAGAQEGPQSRAYIKNVNDSIDAKDLRNLLEKFGEIVYFDVSRQKNCAFVDFKSPEAYKAAVDANPHQLGNERIVVEERRLKPGSYPYVQRGGMRGGRGAPNQGPGRGSYQGGRGGFPSRGRGGASSRGRGSPQAA